MVILGRPGRWLRDKGLRGPPERCRRSATRRDAQGLISRRRRPDDGRPHANAWANRLAGRVRSDMERFIQAGGSECKAGVWVNLGLPQSQCSLSRCGPIMTADWPDAAGSIGSIVTETAAATETASPALPVPQACRQFSARRRRQNNVRQTCGGRFPRFHERDRDPTIAVLPA